MIYIMKYERFLFMLRNYMGLLFVGITPENEEKKAENENSVEMEIT